MTVSGVAASRVPTPATASLPPQTSCVLVLDLTPRADLETPDAKAFAQRVGSFLERARAAHVPVIFTASLSEVDRDLLPECHRRDTEPVFHPDAFDKMRSPDVQRFLTDHGIDNLVVTGAAANHAVMNTVIGAARHFPFDVYVPLDGVHSSDPYTYEYAMYQLSTLPRSARPPHFTTLESIEFLAPAGST